MSQGEDDKPIKRLGVRRFDQGPPERTLTKRVLNTGSGPVTASRLHPAFGPGWSQVRLDIDPSVQPDLIGTICDMRSVVADQSFDAIWASHNLEHLHEHEVRQALGEFRRILKDDGFVLMTCPDLETIAKRVLEHGAETVAYMSPAGPITTLDMLFGHGRSIGSGNMFMCHKTAFTEIILGEAALEAGFIEARVAKGTAYNLWGLFLMPRADLGAISNYLSRTAEYDLAQSS